MSTTSEPRRWYHFTPNRLVAALLAVECILLLYDLILHECLQCFSLWGPTGGIAMLGAAALGLTLFLMLFWFLVALSFGWQFQFSLRSLLAMAIATAVGCGLMAGEVRREKSGIEPAMAIVAAGGRPGCRPTWLGKLFKDDSLAILYYVDLTNTPTTDAELPVLLRGVMQLQSLNLARTRVTDSGLEWVQRWTQLCDLGLNGTQITDAGLAHLHGLKQLRRLSLNSTKITGAGLETIAELNELQHLRLDGVQLCDSDLTRLQGLKQLEDLSLNNTAITDAGLVYLHGLNHLTDLHVCGTNVTKEGVGRLRQVLPDCEVFW
jgi:hypothetical protein